MKLDDLIERDVVNFPNKKESITKKLHKIAKNIDDDISSHHKMEQYVQKEIENIKQQSKGNKPKYKYPSIMSEYQKGIYVPEAIHLEAFEALRDIKQGLDKKQQFALEIALKHKDELIEIIKNDIEQIQELKKAAEGLTTPRIVERIVDKQIAQLKDTLQFFEKTLKKYNKS